MNPPNTYDQLEDDILEILQPLTLGGVETIPMADNNAEYTEAFEKPRITVFYKSSEYSPAIVRGLPDMLNTSHAVQDEFAEVEIGFTCRNRRGAGGIYDIKARAQKLLLGAQPTHFGRFFLKEFAYAEHQEGKGWTYILTVVCKGMAIQGSDEIDENAPLLEQVTINYPQPTQSLLTEHFLGLSTESGLGIISE